MREREEQLSAVEADALKRLQDDMPPPHELKKRVIGKLKDEGLIRPVRDRWEWLRAGYLAPRLAAAVLLLVAGALVGRWSRVDPVPQNGDARYMLVLKAGSATSPAEESSRVTEYGQWAGSLQRRGLLAGGEKLSDDISVIQAVDGRAEVSRPAFDRQTSENGYFLLTTPSYDEALEVAKECPHLKYGGRVEVRQIEHGPGSK